MPFAVNSYDGPGYVESAPPNLRRKTSEQAIRETYRNVMRAHKHNGVIALNWNDYTRTAHLPVGRGRLACDETGEFDKDADRPTFNPASSNPYPRHVHSTITEGESREVRNKDEHAMLLATREWADKPIERKRKFVLTEYDQLANLTAEVRAERAARIQMENRMASSPAVVMESTDGSNTYLVQELADAKEKNSALESQIQIMFDQMRRIEDRFSNLASAAPNAPAPVMDTATTEDDDDDDGLLATPAPKSRKK